MDVHGHFTWQEFPIDITPLLPHSKVVSIPDSNLASVVRKTLDLAPGDVITQIDMQRLEYVEAAERQITNLTGIEQAINLKGLNLDSNRISDITPLTKLTNLHRLTLSDNQISDVSSLTRLISLEELVVWENPIKDRKPLLALLRKNPSVKIYLERGGEPLPVTLSHFRANRTDAGVVVKWTTESELDNAGFNILRSEKKNGEFTVINLKGIISGHGTTNERHTYTWTDTTAKPNVAYYYQIEDISHAGVRQQLATVRMRGLGICQW